MEKPIFMAKIFERIYDIINKGKDVPQDLGSMNLTYISLAHLISYVEVYNMLFPDKKTDEEYNKFVQGLNEAQITAEGYETVLLLYSMKNESMSLLLYIMSDNPKEKYSLYDFVILIIYSIARAIVEYLMNEEMESFKAVEMCGIRANTLQIVFDIIEKYCLNDMQRIKQKKQLGNILVFAYAAVRDLNINAYTIGYRYEYSILFNQIARIMRALRFEVPKFKS